MNKNNLAVIVGGTGAIGDSIAHEICKIGFSDVLKIGTKTTPSIDFNNENTILDTIEFVKKKNKPISIFFDATGILHENNVMPEKSLKKIEFEFVKKNFLINAIGPALLIKHFAPLLDKDEKSVFASLSA